MNQGVGMKHDGGKNMLGLLIAGMPEVIYHLGTVLTFGAKKYKADSWKTVPSGKDRYLDAAYRHLIAWHSGEKSDSESGIHHIFHAIINLMFVAWFELKEGNDVE